MQYIEGAVFVSISFLDIFLSLNFSLLSVP